MSSLNFVVNHWSDIQDSMFALDPYDLCICQEKGTPNSKKVGYSMQFVYVQSIKFSRLAPTDNANFPLFYNKPQQTCCTYTYDTNGKEAEW